MAIDAARDTPEVNANGAIRAAAMATAWASMLAGFDQPLSPARPANGAMNTLPPPASVGNAAA